jgi:isoquinoline 1-oxidoreductase alpha subunit
VVWRRHEFLTDNDVFVETTMVGFTLNGKPVEVDGPPETPLLWVVRDHLKLSGTKFGCLRGLCGACTVHVDGKAVRSCQTFLGDIDGADVITIEGLSPNRGHPLQKAWIAEQVAQCGYCQSGQIMQAATLLETNPSPSREEIIQHMNGNLCRCGTYLRIIRAIELAASET